MATGTKTTLDRAFKVYALDDTHFFLSWIAEGTDGKLYMVPSEPGGWHKRVAYSGPREGLKAVMPEKSYAIARFVGGDRTGQETVAIASSEPAGNEGYSYMDVGSVTPPSIS